MRSPFVDSIIRVSQGKIVGSMLHPVTPRRKIPDERSNSPASSHFTAWNSDAVLIGIICYDELPCKPHAPVPPTIFPQDKAVVTKTCSWRNVGFSYGFFWLAAIRGCSEDD